MSDGLVDCGSVRESFGVLVLGAIDPAERAQVESHVQGCGTCAAELAEYAPLPGLLAHVDRSWLHLEASEAGEAPAEVLDRALAEIHRERLEGHGPSARHRKASVVGLVAAAVAVMLVALGVGAGAGQVLWPTRPPVIVASAANAGTGVAATIAMHPTTAGTRVLLTLSGVTPGGQCQLVVVGKDGQREIAASWVASYEGQAQVAGTTGLPTDRISSFDISTPQGATLLRIPVVT